MKKRNIFLAFLLVFCVASVNFVSASNKNEGISNERWTKLEGNFTVYNSILFKDASETYKTLYDNELQSYLKKAEKDEIELQKRYEESYQDFLSTHLKTNNDETDSVSEPEPQFDETEVAKQLKHERQVLKEKLLADIEGLPEKIRKVMSNDKFKLINGSLEQLPSETLPIKLGDKQFLYDKVVNQNITKITRKNLSSPVAMHTSSGDRMVIAFKQDLYAVDPVSWEAKKITKTTYERVEKEQFLSSEKGKFWLEAANLSPDGNSITFYSNRNGDGIWLYSFKSNSETQLIGIAEFPGAIVVNPYTHWLDDNRFLFTVMDENEKNRHFQYDINKQAYQLLHETKAGLLVEIENGFLVYRDGDEMVVMDLLNNQTQRFHLEERGLENKYYISKEGNVAIKYYNKIVVLDRLTGKTYAYLGPDQTARYSISNWIDNQKLLIVENKKAEKTSWILEHTGDEK